MLKHTINTYTHTHTDGANPTISTTQVHDHSSKPITMDTILSLCAQNPVIWQKSWVGHIIKGIFVVPKHNHTIWLTHTQTHVALTHTDRHAHSKGHTFTHFCCVCKHPYCIHRPFTATYLHAHSAHSTYLLFTEMERRLKALLKL